VETTTFQTAATKASNREVFVSIDSKVDATEGLAVETDSDRSVITTLHTITSEQLSDLGLQSEETHLTVLQASADAVIATYIFTETESLGEPSASQL